MNLFGMTVVLKRRMTKMQCVLCTRLWIPRERYVSLIFSSLEPNLVTSRCVLMFDESMNEWITVSEQMNEHIRLLFPSRLMSLESFSL